MLEPHQKDLQEILAGRLVEYIGDDLEQSDVGIDPNAEREDEEEGSRKNVAVDELQPIDETVDEIHPDTTHASELQVPTFAKVEKSLISLGFFTPSSRRIKNQKIKTVTFTRTVDGKKVVATAEFHPSATLGLPITADQDKFLALHHIITTLLKETGTISNPIKFTSAEMLRLLNKERDSGKNYKDISEWLDVMMSTTIMSNGVVYEAGKQRFARDRFHVFARAVSVGKEMPDGTIADANYVWLSEWQLENINAKFLLPIDLLTYRELRNHIAKALVPLLQVWLFASRPAGSFEKRYDDLCEMLSLKGYKAASRITQQLKGSLDELTQHGYLEKWRIEKVADKKSFKIVFFHGPKYHRDRRRRLAEKTLAEATTVVSEWQPTDVNLPEPGGLETDSPAPVAPTPAQVLARKPVESSDADNVNRSGEVGKESPEAQTSETSEGAASHETLEASLMDELSSRGLMPSSAMKLLRGISPERLEAVGDYIDYWDTTKRTKDVGEGFLYSLIKDGNPLPSNFQTRRKREEREATEARRRNYLKVKDELRTAYEHHCEKMIDRLITENLPPGEFEKRLEVRTKELIQQGGFWEGVNRDEIVGKIARHDIRKELSAGTVVSYDDFYRRQLPATLEKLQLDPEAIGLKAI